MWLKEYIDYLKAARNDMIKKNAIYPKKSYLYQMTNLNIAIKEFWITICESFVRGIK